MEQSTKKCGIELPYPDTLVSAPDPRYARMLGALLAGQRSELTAITSYSYQATVLSAGYTDVASVLWEVAETEMRHLALLSKAIVELGGDPRYLSCKEGCAPQYWNARYCNYERHLTSILLDDIASERDAICAYNAVIANVRDERLKALLSRIVLDEQEHVLCLSELYKLYK